VRTPLGHQSHARFPLSALLGDSGHVRVLRALLSYDGPLSTVQIARETGLSRQAVRLVLGHLLTQGAVQAMGTARSRLFSAATGAPFVAALKPLFAAERTRWESLQSALRDALLAAAEVRSAWLYGSVSRREDTPDSDLDIALVLAEGSPEGRIRDELDALAARYGVDISLIVLTSADIARRPTRDPWWAGLERDAQVLKGLSPAQERDRAKNSAGVLRDT